MWSWIILFIFRNFCQIFNTKKSKKKKKTLVIYYGVPIVLKYFEPRKISVKIFMQVPIECLCERNWSTFEFNNRCNVHLQIEIITNNWRKEIYDLECKMEFMNWLSDKRIDSIRQQLLLQNVCTFVYYDINSYYIWLHLCTFVFYGTNSYYIFYLFAFVFYNRNSYLNISYCTYDWESTVLLEDFLLRKRRFYCFKFNISKFWQSRNNYTKFTNILYL